MGSLTRTLVGYHKDTGERIFKIEAVNGLWSVYEGESTKISTGNGSLDLGDVVSDITEAGLEHGWFGYKHFYYASQSIMNAIVGYESNSLFPQDLTALEDWLTTGQEAIVSTMFSEISWPMTSVVGEPLIFAGGFYEFGGSVDNFSSPVVFGDSKHPHGAHFMLVAGGTFSADTTYHVNGTKFSDTGVLEADYDATMVFPTGTEANAYISTEEKWVGQVTVTKTSGDNINSCYGYCKYFEGKNLDFTVVGLEGLWLAGANDSGFDIELVHHSPTGWTYNASGTPVHPTAFAKLTEDYGDNHELSTGEYGAWKRTNLEVPISSSYTEGILVMIHTTSSRAIVEGSGSLLVRLRSTL